MRFPASDPCNPFDSDESMIKQLGMRSRFLSGRMRLFVLILAAVATLAAVRHSNSSLRIGFLGELSGRGSLFGLAGRNGASLAVEQANDSGGVLGRKVELIAVGYQDGKRDVLEGLRRLEAYGVSAIVGPMTSSASMELMRPEPVTNLVMISPTSETSRLAGIDDQFFRVTPASNLSVRILVKHLLDTREVKSVSIVLDTDNQAFTRDWQEEFSREYVRRGGRVLDVVPFSSKDLISFSALCDRIVASGADGVLLLTHATDTALFCQQVAKRQLRLACFCTSWASSPDLVRMGGRSVEGLTWVQGSRYDDDTPVYRDFCRAYRKRFSRDPDYAALHAYEATGMLLAALAEDPDVPLRERLRNLGSFVGPQDTLVLTPGGDVVRNLHLLTIRRGEIVSIAHSRMSYADLLGE